MATQPPPALTVAIGESAFAVAARVPGLIDVSLLSDNQPMMIDHPLQLTVRVKDHALALPPTRMVAIDQVAGVVTGVGLAPMLGYADLATSRDLAVGLVRHAEAAGWTVTQRAPVDLAAMAAQIAQPTRGRYNKTVATLARDGAALRVYIKEASGAGLEERDPPARGTLFLVNTDFTAPALDDRQNEILFARRRALTGGVDSVPLTAFRTAP